MGVCTSSLEEAGVGGGVFSMMAPGASSLEEAGLGIGCFGLGAPAMEVGGL